MEEVERDRAIHPGGGEGIDIEEAAVPELGIPHRPAGQPVVLAGQHEIESIGIGS